MTPVRILNFKVIGSKLTGKSPKIMRSWLIILNLTASIAICTIPIGSGFQAWDSGVLNVIYHPLYGMNNYVLIWGDWLSCDPLRGSHDSQSSHESQSPHIWGDWLHVTVT